MKIVVNKCYGGFGLSPQALSEYWKKKGKTVYFFKQRTGYTRKRTVWTPLSLSSLKSTDNRYDAYLVSNPQDYDDKKQNELYVAYTGDLKRDDPDLVKTVEELGQKANSWTSELKIIDIPDGIEWEINDYDGFETIHEKHNSW